MDLKEIGKMFLQNIAVYALGFVFYLIGSRFRLNSRDFMFLIITLFYGGMSLSYSLGSRITMATELIDRPANEQSWDRSLRLCYKVLTFGVLFFVAGLCYDPEAQMTRLTMVSMILLFLSLMLRSKALRIQPFLDPMLPVDPDRIHNLKAEGSYMVIRHPAQSAAILYTVSAMGVFVSVPTLVVGLVIIILTIIRTRKIDRYLKENVRNFDRFEFEVPYRLFPNIW